MLDGGFVTLLVIAELVLLLTHVFFFAVNFAGVPRPPHAIAAQRPCRRLPFAREAERLRLSHLQCARAPPRS